MRPLPLAASNGPIYFSVLWPGKTEQSPKMLQPNFASFWKESHRILPWAIFGEAGVKKKCHNGPTRIRVVDEKVKRGPHPALSTFSPSSVSMRSPSTEVPESFNHENDLARSVCSEKTC